MKNPKGEDSASKALQERYASILGLDVTSDAANKNPVRRRLPFFFLILAAVALGSVWFFFESSSLPVSAPARTLPEPHPSPASSTTPDSSGKAKADLAGPATFNSKQTLPDSLPGTSVRLDRPNVPDDSDVQSSLRGTAPWHSEETRRDPAATGAFLVVLLSTKSKDEALKRTQELASSGYTSRVILSSTGYYGVVIRHDTYEQATETLQKIHASGIVRQKPYIMSANRVKAYLP